MSDAEIKFEREDVSGLVAVGTKLLDAGRRFGVRFDVCKPELSEHSCLLTVSSGIDNLSSLTESEKEHFAANGRRSNGRLACEAQIIKSGEIVIMTEAKTADTKTAGAATNRLQEEFGNLPLDKKFTSLLQMEASTFNEAIKYVADGSLKVLEKVGDAISDFGSKVEAEAKSAVSDREPSQAPKASTAKPKTNAKKPPVKKA